MNRELLSYLFFFALVISLSSQSRPICEEFYTKKPVARLNNIKIVTPRFEIRPLQWKDFTNASQLMLDPLVRDMSGDFEKKGIPQYLDKYSSYIELYARKLATSRSLSSDKMYAGFGLTFGIFQENTLIGLCGLFKGAQRAIIPEATGKKIFSVSYHLFPEVWGKGIATEVGFNLVNFAFRNLNADIVHGQALKSNAGSNSVLQKIGLLPFPQEDPIYNHFIVERSTNY